MLQINDFCHICHQEFKADSEELYWHLKIHQVRDEMTKVPTAPPLETDKE